MVSHQMREEPALKPSSKTVNASAKNHAVKASSDEGKHSKSIAEKSHTENSKETHHANAMHVDANASIKFEKLAANISSPSSKAHEKVHKVQGSKKSSESSKP